MGLPSPKSSRVPRTAPYLSLAADLSACLPILITINKPLAASTLLLPATYRQYLQISLLYQSIYIDLIIASIRPFKMRADL